ncbi:MAG TPA: CoA transferase [Oceanospirillaceae bacterium]|nr:CoA transferase [Oceanospirillaceae bacterium]
MQLPLEGIKVLDLSRILAGPWAGQMLADLGADVIKVERPGKGDDTRAWAPPYMPVKDGGDDATRESAYFQSANRGKRSICIDMALPAGQALIKRLAAEADVVIENFKVGGLAKYGLDFASLSALNPKLIYCSITGFGQTGPDKDRAGYDFMIQATGGLMSITGAADGEPMKVGVALADVMTGLYASNAIQAALIHQLRSGQGQHIDLALLDVQVATLANQAMNYLATGENPKRLGNAHPNIVPYQVFATADSHMIIAVGNDSQYQRFCQVGGNAALGTHEDYASNALRVANRDALVPQLQSFMSQQTTAWWLAELNKVGVPCGPINTLDQVFADAQVQARGMQLDLPHKGLGLAASVANPIKLSATPIQYTKGAPMLGEHTEQVLQDWLQLNAQQLAELHQSQTIA